MEPMYYIGLDVHKLKISYCVKDSGGKLSADYQREVTVVSMVICLPSRSTTRFFTSPGVPSNSCRASASDPHRPVIDAEEFVARSDALYKIFPATLSDATDGVTALRMRTDHHGDRAEARNRQRYPPHWLATYLLSRADLPTA